MKSKKLVIIASIIGVLCLGTFVGAYFYAKSLVTPEKVREMSLTFLKKTFPKSKIELGKTEINFGFSIKVNVDSLSIHGPKYNLASLENLTIDVPIFSILTGGGDLTISLNSPNIHYIETEKSNNWSIALEGPIKKASKKDAGKKATEDISKAATIGIPTFLLNSTASLNIKNLILHYELKDSSKGSVTLEKVLFKKIGIKNSSAYEISSKLDYKMKSGESLNLDALLIGQFNLTEIISKQKIETVSVLKIKNMKVPGIKNTLPEIKAEINTAIEKNGKVLVDSNITFLDKNRIAMKINIDSGRVRVDKIDTELILKDLLTISGISISSLDPKTSSIKLSGSVSVSKKGTITPNLNFSLGPNLTYVDKNFTTRTTLAGSLVNKSFKAKAEAKVLDGTIIFQNVMTIDLNNLPTEKNLPKSNTLLNIQNISLTENLIQEMLYSGSQSTSAAEVDSSSREAEQVKNTAPASAPIIIPPGDLTVKMNNVKIGNKPFSLESKINLSPKKIEVSDTTFHFSSGSGSSSAVVSLGKNATTGVFDFDLKNFDLIALKPFLPKNVLSAVLGVFSGKANGKFTVGAKGASYDVLTNVKAVNGELKDINIGDYVKPILNSIPKLGEKYAGKEIDVDGKFSSLSLNGRFTDSMYSIKSTKFIDAKKYLEITGNGNVSPLPTKNSVFNVNYRDLSGKISKVLTKEIGTNIVPLKLVGKGFSLKPDIEYTLKKVSKTAVKVQAKKQIKKLLNEDGKKKINKLLKGLFN
ncbi:hypothetical protein [Halobacteriovorax sp. JY17]|uniref:hypothetical protein n=1 Tax=Halobacteriovorax sp. JY17 TaxID=2014617 RepID=UPI000C4AC2F2|nr:hypothetical protein [Halobacteriovorax sp. JY17]PIK14540.1 MAG: hypothetical protein CES88_09350 [Halobacteriovorax sp. JY17]